MKTARIINFVGIDISKSWFNVYIIQKLAFRHIQFRCDNSPEGIIELKQRLKTSRVSLSTLTVVTLEHTGIYGKLLINFFANHGVNLCVEMGVRIKRSLGTAKGKDDSIDARRIAEYSRRHLDKLCFYVKKSKSLETVKTLLKNRSRLLRAKTMIETPLKELQNYSYEKDNRYFRSVNLALTKALKETSTKITTEIERIVESDEELKRQVSLLIGIPGIGFYTAVALICYTNRFTNCNTSSQLASYCGCAPFTYSSGIRPVKSHTNKMSNRFLKGHLHLAALSLMHSQNEIREYYERKVAEGKPKSLIINNVGHKLLLRVMAVIKRDSKYIPTEKFVKQREMLQVVGVS
jgi:transposase